MSTRASHKGQGAPALPDKPAPRGVGTGSRRIVKPATTALEGRGRRLAVTQILMVTILLIGAVLRLAAFDETLIEPDQAAILDAAFQIAHFRYFPLTGMKSSVGVMQTGIVPLLAAIPLLFVKRIIAVQAFFSALDLLALAWLARAVRRAVGHRAANVAALLYATAPWVILYARTIWYQTLIAGLATVAFGCLLVLFSSRPADGRHLTLAMVSITALSMVHLAAAPFGALLMALCLVLAWRRRLARACAFGLAWSALIALPYLLHLVRASFGDLAFILTAGQSSTGINSAAYRLAAELASGAMIVANAHGDLWDRSVIAWPAGPSLVLIILAASALWALIAVARRPRRRESLLLAMLWTLVVPTLFLRSDVHLQHFYLMSLFPAPYVLIGMAVDDTTRRARYGLWSATAVAGRLATAVLVAVALWWASLWLARIDLEAQGELERETRGWLMDRTADVVAAYLAEEPQGSFIVLSDFEGEASAFEWLRGYTQSDRVRVVPTGKGFLIPDGPACYLLGPRVLAETLWSVPSFAETPARRIPARPPWAVVCGQLEADGETPRAAWSNGLSLLRTEVTGDLEPGSELHITHTWHYRATAPGAYNFYNHLLLDGSLVAQVDGGSVPHWHWRDGDTLLTYFTLEVPDDLQPGEYVLRVGMYTWPGLERVRLLSGDDGFNAYSASF